MPINLIYHIKSLLLMVSGLQGKEYRLIVLEDEMTPLSSGARQVFPGSSLEVLFGLVGLLILAAVCIGYTRERRKCRERLEQLGCTGSCYKGYSLSRLRETVYECELKLAAQADEFAERCE